MFQNNPDERPKRRRRNQRVFKKQSVKKKVLQSYMILGDGRFRIISILTGYRSNRTCLRNRKRTLRLERF
ncbi:hypothetical protein Mapa_016918 [Marchantia paleacea]|nr:hypothetical protein Mapa_016918 [Marchantia paleacea]